MCFWTTFFWNNVLLQVETSHKLFHISLSPPPPSSWQHEIRPVWIQRFVFVHRRISTTNPGKPGRWFRFKCCKRDRHWKSRCTNSFGVWLSSIHFILKMPLSGSPQCFFQHTFCEVHATKCSAHHCVTQLSWRSWTVLRAVRIWWKNAEVMQYDVMEVSV